MPNTLISYQCYLFIELIQSVYKMRVLYTANRKAPNAKYNQQHPKRSTANRHLNLAKKGKTLKLPGRPKKGRLNFNTNLLNQNRNMIAQNGIDFVLGEDDGVDKEYRLRRSSNHGLGVYLANTRETQCAADGLDIYLFSVDSESDTVIDATKRGNIACFINHSCSPNCEFVGNDETNTIQIVSLCPIKYGTEITINYRLLPGEEPIKCNYEKKERLLFKFILLNY